MAANLAYLLAHDTTYGPCNQEILSQDDKILVNGVELRLFLNQEPEQIDWAGLGVEVLIDATGDPASVEKAVGLAPEKVKKVLITRSVKRAQATLARGVNFDHYNPREHHAISCSTCTANALAPTLMVLDNAYGVERVSVTSVHPALSGDALLDAPSAEFSAGRSAMGVRPVKSSVPETTAQLLPQLKDKIMAMTLRVPTLVVNALMVDVVLKHQPQTKAEVAEIFQTVSQSELKDVLCLDQGFCGQPKVANDFAQTTYSAVIDQNWLDLNGPILRILIWHDNEYAYCCRVVDTLEVIAGKF
jgi:glyceraldehyde 3-phosphate dehydrogenase